MEPGGARLSRWPRYVVAVAAVVWLLGGVAGCCFPVPGLVGVAAAHAVVTADAGHVFAEAPGSNGADADCCRAGLHDCAPVLHSGASTGLVALGTGVAIPAPASWPATPVAAPRGPPDRVRAAPPLAGRDILTRICIARR